jgi:hypothetical protein
MTITYRLADADGGTDLTGLHENVPPGVSPADNEMGWRMSIDKSPDCQTRPFLPREQTLAGSEPLLE